MMKKRRRDIQIFSLSFLDCICCGFGAVILLFVLSKFAEPLIIEEVKVDLEAKIIRLEEELVEIRGETTILNRDLTAKRSNCLKKRSGWQDYSETCLKSKANSRAQKTLLRSKILSKANWPAPCRN